MSPVFSHQMEDTTEKLKPVLIMPPQLFINSLQYRTPCNPNGNKKVNYKSHLYAHIMLPVLTWTLAKEHGRKIITCVMRYLRKAVNRTIRNFFSETSFCGNITCYGICRGTKNKVIWSFCEDGPLIPSCQNIQHEDGNSQWQVKARERMY